MSIDAAERSAIKEMLDSADDIRTYTFPASIVLSLICELEKAQEDVEVLKLRTEICYSGADVATFIAERDAARALLRLARLQIGKQHTDLRARISKELGDS